MLITTLGTSHGNHTYCRFNSTTLVESGDRSYLVDCGEAGHALMVRAGKAPEQLSAAFVTHMHQDHVGGVPDLIKRLVKYAEEGRVTSVYLPEREAVSALGAWLRAMHVKWPSPVVAVRVSHPGPLYDDGCVQVAGLETGHMRGFDAPSFAFAFACEGKRVVFTGDLRGDFSDFPELVRSEPCAACVCEITHFKPETALPVLAQCEIGQLILNHVHDPWHGEGEQRLKALMRALPYPVHIAHDGDVFTI